jgi:hypothetical protein
MRIRKECGFKRMRRGDEERKGGKRLRFLK